MILATARLATEEAVIRPALPLVHLPGMTEMQMTKMSYREQLLHPNWQRKRLETLDAAGWACRKCECTDVTLHVHHKRYVKGRMAWEYERDELEVLCADCHAAEHDLKDLLERVINGVRILGEAPEQDPLTKAIGLLAGYYAGHFAGDVDEGVSIEAYEAAPVSYTRGMLLGVMAGVVQLWQIADLIEQAYAEAGQPLEGEAAKLIGQIRKSHAAAQAQKGVGQ